MSGDGRAARASVQRTASVSRTLAQPSTLFAEPPAPLANLDELRASDLFIRAYCDAIVAAAPHGCAASLDPSSPAHTAAVAVEGGVRPALSAEVATAEARAVGEVLCAALARDVVEAAAQLYTARQLDELVASYTACAVWDDARDVVASAFLPQDTMGPGIVAPQAPLQPSSVPHLSGLHARCSRSPPFFMRSALALAGMSTRQPTCTLTPQSSLSPPPLGCAALCGGEAPDSTADPVPPAGVPMDAYSRYVTVMEAAPELAEAALAQHSRPSPSRSRPVRSAAKASEPGGAAASAPALTPAPPSAGGTAGKRSARGPQRRSQLPSQSSPLLTSPKGGRQAFGATAAPPPPEDALTRALRHSQSHGAAGAGVVAVEQDRLVHTERGGRVTGRGGQRKDAVRCRVVTGDVAEPPPAGAAAAPTDSATEAAQPAGAAQRTGKRVPQPSSRTGGAAAAAAAKVKKAQTAEREAWAATFFSPTDAASGAALQEQVQVTPSPGVTVVGAAASPSSTYPTRRGQKGAGAAAAAAVTHGGDFAVPADRLALSAFDEKRAAAAARKANGAAGRSHGASKGRSAQTTKAS